MVVVCLAYIYMWLSMSYWRHIFYLYCGYGPRHILLSHFLFVHCSLTVCSPFPHRVSIVYSLRPAFTIRSHSPFTRLTAFTHRAFTCRSQSVQRWFGLKFSLSFRTLLKDQYHNDYKQVGVSLISETWVSLLNKTKKNSQNFVKLEPEVK